MLHLSAMAKQLLLACLIANRFFPFGLSDHPGLADYAGGAAMLCGKVALAGAGLALVESLFAKMRLYELPDLLGSASLASLLAAAITAWRP